MQPPTRPSSPLAALVVALLFVTAACGGGFARRGAQPEETPSAPRRIGGGLEEFEGEEEAPQGDDPSEGESVSGSGEGQPRQFILVMVDQNGNHPAGIPVEIGGAKTMNLTSDAEGRVVVEGEPGFYTYKVPVRCGDVIETRAGGTGRFGISEDQGGIAEVRVDWQHRYGPSGPAFSSYSPDWPVGRDVEVRYDLVERCPRQGGRITNKEFASYAYEIAAHIQIVGQPSMRSDDKGYAYVTVRCTSEGPAKLVVHDTENPSDRLDLAEEIGGEDPSCRDLN